MFINSDVFMFCIKKFSNIVFATVLTLNLLVASGKTTLKKTSPMKRLFRCSCFPTRSRSSESKNVAAPSPPKRQLSQSPDKSPSREVPIQSESDTSDVDVWHEYPNPFADFVMITMLKFKEGDVLFTQQGRTLVAISETKLAQVLAGKRCWSWTAIITRNKRVYLAILLFLNFKNLDGRKPQQEPIATFQRMSSLSFERGNVLETTSGDLFLAVSNEELVFVRGGLREIFTGTTTVQLIPANDVKKNRRLKVRLKNVHSYFFERDKSIALAKKLIDKKLPFGWLRCNKKHYWDYILNSTTHTTTLFKYCPLTRYLKNTPIKEIEGEDFFLENAYWKKIYIKDLPAFSSNSKTTVALNASSRTSKCESDKSVVYR
nr:PREDICTED: uncharacterized protein LOC109034385 isoform X2 [Bemisia tabaci]